MANIILHRACGRGQSISTSVTDTAQTTSFASSKFQVAAFSQMTLQLTTASVTGTSPTLDVAVQKLLPDGTTWQAVAQFSQITAATKRIIHMTSSGNLEEGNATALTGGTVHAVPFGGWWRLNYVIGGTNPSFTITTAIEAIA